MIELVFGKPGSGKSTLLASRAAKNEFHKRFCNFFGNKLGSLLRRLPFLKYYDVVYSTDPTIKFTTPITYEHLGEWVPPSNSLFLLEEVGLGFNNRNWKKMTDLQKRFFAKHRHWNCDILAVSQTVDCDISIRHRALRLWQLKKISLPLLRHFTIMVPISFKIGVDNETHKLDEIYSVPEGFFRVLFSIIFFRYRVLNRKKYYRYFDSWEDEMIGKYPKKNPC